MGIDRIRIDSGRGAGRGRSAHVSPLRRPELPSGVSTPAFHGCGDKLATGQGGWKESTIRTTCSGGAPSNWRPAGGKGWEEEARRSLRTGVSSLLAATEAPLSTGSPDALLFPPAPGDSLLTARVTSCPGQVLYADVACSTRADVLAHRGAGEAHTRIARCAMPSNLPFASPELSTGPAPPRRPGPHFLSRSRLRERQRSRWLW
jgi:hypothetical protein